MIRFLDYSGSYIGTKIDILHDLTIEELVSLRDAITAFRRMWEDYHEHLSKYVEIVVTHPDFNTLRMNKGMMGEVINTINGAIGRRRLKALQEKRRKQK